MKVQADTMNGVYEVVEFSEGVTVEEQATFIDWLGRLEDSDTMAAELDAQAVETVRALYGLKTLGNE